MNKHLLMASLIMLAILTGISGKAQSVTVTNESGSGNCDGSAVLNNSGAYVSWNWMSDSTIVQSGGTSFDSLCAGVYVLSYTDTSGTSSYTFTVSTDSVNPCQGFAVSVSVVNTVANSCNGSANAVVTGGSAPFAYSWSTGSTSANLSGLCSGTYTVSVSDANGCSVTGSSTVNTDSSSVSGPSVTITNQSGSGSCDGSAVLNNSGAYVSWNWMADSTIVQTGGTSFDSLCAGVYVLSYTDSTGTSSYTFTVGTDSLNPCQGFAISVSASDAASNVCNGSASAVISGGTAPFSFAWNTGSNYANLNNLCAGTYSVTVSDANGCSATGTSYVYTDSIPASISNISALAYAINESSNGSCDGEVMIVVSGGVAPYTYNHDNGSATTSSVSNLCAGVHTVTITDANSDSYTLQYLISSPSNTVVNTSFSDSTAVDTVSSVLVQNCVIDYNSIDSAVIDNIQYFSNDSVDVTWAVYYGGNGVTYVNIGYALPGGNGVYSVILTLNCEVKQNGQFLSAQDQLYYSTGALSVEEKFEVEMNVYPNPFNDVLTVKFENPDDYTVELYTVAGQRVLVQQEFSDLMIIDVNYLPHGQYILSVIGSNGSKVQKLIK